MELKPIKSEEEYEMVLEWVDNQFEQKPVPDSPGGNRLQIALLLIKAYEDSNYQIPTPDPIEAIKLKMSGKDLKGKDFGDCKNIS